MLSRVNDPLSQFIFFWTSSTVFHIDGDESYYDQNQKNSPVIALGCYEQILVKISAKSSAGIRSVSPSLYLASTPPSNAANDHTSPVIPTIRTLWSGRDEIMDS